MERRKARHQALRILYQREITGESVSDIIDGGSYLPDDEEEDPTEGGPSEFARRVSSGVEAHQERIDEVIGSISENWTVHRMPPVDRSILRIAVWEMLYAEDIPSSVSINEAVEMAKVYGGDDSSKFVNGILGRLAEEPGTASKEAVMDD